MTRQEYEDFRIACGEKLNRRPPELVYVPLRKRRLAEKRAQARTERLAAGQSRPGATMLLRSPGENSRQ